MLNIDLIFDIFDQAAMIYYENLKIDYLSALGEINKNLNISEYDSRLPDKVIDYLELVYKPLQKGNFKNEEIRLALELFIVKGLKHINYPQNLMTPDFINYLFVVIINELFVGETINIIDTSLGTGNLLAAMKNNYPGDASLIGIENDLRLTEFAGAFMDVQQNDIKIYFQDALNAIHDRVEFVVGDLDSYYVSDDLNLKNEL